MRQGAALTTRLAMCGWMIVAAACGGSSPTAPGVVTVTPSPVAPTPPDPSTPTAPTPAPGPVPTLGVSRVLCFGDSMTSGFVAPTAQFLIKTIADSYPTRLQALLQERYRNQTFAIENAGKMGEWAEDGAERLVPLVRASRPEVVILLEGVNDISGLGSGGVELALESLENMLRDSRALGAKVMLASLPPQRPERGDTVFVAELNSGIARLAQRQQVLFVDVNRAFGGDLSLIGADGLHPTAAGYLRIAQAVFDVMRTNFEQPVTPTHLTD